MNKSTYHQRFKTMEQRFWEKVDKKEDGCWVWTANTNHKGYGMFSYSRYKTIKD